MSSIKLDVTISPQLARLLVELNVSEAPSFTSGWFNEEELVEWVEIKRLLRKVLHELDALDPYWQLTNERAVSIFDAALAAAVAPEPEADRET